MTLYEFYALHLVGTEKKLHIASIGGELSVSATSKSILDTCYNFMSSDIDYIQFGSALIYIALNLTHDEFKDKMVD